MRKRSAAKMAASSPPVPPRISMMTSRSSLGSRGSSWSRSWASRSTSWASSSAMTSRTSSFISGSVSASRSRRAAASCSRTPRSRRWLSTSGASCACSRPRTRLRSGSEATSGRDHSASISVRRRSISSRRASRLMGSPGRPRRERCSSAMRASTVCASSVASGMGSRGGSQLPSGATSSLAARASCMEQMATSIMESSGCFVVIACSQMPGRKSQRQTECSRRLAPHLRIS